HHRWDETALCGTAKLAADRPLRVITRMASDPRYVSFHQSADITPQMLTAALCQEETRAVQQTKLLLACHPPAANRLSISSISALLHPAFLNSAKSSSTLTSQDFSPTTFFVPR